MKIGFSGKPTPRQSLVYGIFTKQYLWDQQYLWEGKEGNKIGQKNKFKLRYWHWTCPLWKVTEIGKKKRGGGKKKKRKKKGLLSVLDYIKTFVPSYTCFNRSIDVISLSVREDMASASSCLPHSKRHRYQMEKGCQKQHQNVTLR